MRIGIHDPYLNTLGGGERYILTAAECLAGNNQVELFWDDTSTLSRAQERFNLNLKGVTAVENIFAPKYSTISRMEKSKEYDVIIAMSDGSIPLLLAKKNILIFQHPVNWVNGKSFTNKIKFSKVHAVLCYSNFVKAFLDKTFPKTAQILYPPVEAITYGEAEKKNMILTVGRFTKAMNAKKQNVLIDSFKQLCQGGLRNWELVLAGSYLNEDQDFVTEMEKLAQGYPIRIAANAPYADLLMYYKQAKIYWHAAGFGENLAENPERAEHFGITTVEAMSAGAVPIVFNGGGQKEIVTEGVNGYVWNTLEELQQKTTQIMTDDAKRIGLAQAAVKRAEEFSVVNFCTALNELVAESTTK